MSQSDKLNRLIERARDHKMTPDQLFEQRVSFVYGQQDHDSPHSMTKDEVRAHLAERYGDPKAMREEARKAERAAIVAWLREGGANVIASEIMRDLATAIERTDHLGEGG